MSEGDHSGSLLPRTAKVALLDSYAGGNLGDAAILDATISHFRKRIPGVALTSITLSVSNMERRHGVAAPPLCCNDLPYYYMCWGERGPASWGEHAARSEDARRGGREHGRGRSASASPRGGTSASGLRGAAALRLRGAAASALRLRGGGAVLKGWIKAAMPNAWKASKRVYLGLSWVPREVKHFLAAYRFLRSHTLLVVAGGGQFDEEWGGPWGHPYALFKWALAARLAGTPCAVASVGVCKLDRAASQFFLRSVMRSAAYRSYRDAQSRSFAARLLRCASDDAVVPDLAFALQASSLPAADPSRGLPAAGRSRARGANQRERVIAISPIAYKRPASWPVESRSIYSRYLSEMKSLILDLLDRDYRLLFCWSAIPDDQTAFHEILAQFDAEEEARLRSHASVASIENWPDLVAAFRDVDLAVASRLHSVILSLVAQTPVVAISFDQKVDRVMQDLGCSRFVVDIHDFTSADVLVKLGEAEAEMDAYRRDISRFTQDAAERLDRQFDRLAAMAQPGREEDKDVALSAACPPATDVTLAREPKADECRGSR